MKYFKRLNYIMIEKKKIHGRFFGRVKNFNRILSIMIELRVEYSFNRKIEIFIFIS